MTEKGRTTEKTRLGKIMTYFHLDREPSIVVKSENLRKQATLELDRAIDEMIAARKVGKNGNG